MAAEISSTFDDKQQLPKLIDARTHGIIDYCHSGFFFTMALVCRKKNPRAAGVAAATGGFILAEALLTDYPVGVNRVIPFATHGVLDGIFAAASFFVPTLFGFAGTKASSVFKINAFVEATAVALTDFDSERAREDES